MIVAMKNQSEGFSLVEVLIVILVVGILAAFAIPNLNRILNVFRTRATAEALAQQISLTRQAAITFGHRSSPIPISLYLYPSYGSKGVGLWFDKNNTGINPITQAPPSKEIIYLPQTMRVGSDLSASAQCSFSGNTPASTSAPAPVAILKFNSRGELPVDFTVPACLKKAQDDPSASIYVETVKSSKVISKYIVSVSLRGSVNITTF
jgi:prepilin-type N-terminal cleavage/methylation domain-containing protein